MTQTMIPSSTTVSDLDIAAHEAAPITWMAPGDDLWVASRADADGMAFLGFVELTLEEYVVVDGEGRSLGRHADLAAAQRALVSAAA